MSGKPSEAEWILQLQGAVDILETTRVHADATMATAGGKYDTLEQRLEGEFTPVGLANAIDAHRAGLAAVVSPEMARQFLDPVFLEAAQIIDDAADWGGGYADVDAIIAALYEYLHNGAKSVQSRDITYNTPALSGGAAGNGVLRRVTVDENNYAIEACSVEKKYFRCRQDQNSGTQEHAEVFEVLGSRASPDGLLMGETGSGVNTAIVSRHAGSGENGGSILSNSSFGEFSATGTPKFTAWGETIGGSGSAIGESSSVYRSHPGEGTARSLEMSCRSSGTITLKQTLENMAVTTLRPDRPYFCRVMVKDGGSAAGGSVNLRVGAQGATGSSTALITSFAGGGWTEIFLALNNLCWFVNLNEDGFDVEVEWTGGTAGTVLFDDAIFCECVLIDGLYYVLTHNADTPTMWAVDDEITVTDAYTPSFGEGKVQYWTQRAYGRYLPHSGTPTIADP
jgi:hypothetical protein